MHVRIGNISIESVVGDIARQHDIDAVVNAANKDLRPGGGVAGAIHRGAGEKLESATRPLAPITPGECVITRGFRLPNGHIIHCLGPIYNVDTPSAHYLAMCYTNALKIAQRHGIKSIAFPIISSGAFGYPMKPAVELAIDAALKHAEAGEKPSLIRFVLYDAVTADVFDAALKEKTH